MAVISMNSTGKDAPRDETSNSPLQVVEPSNFSLPAGDSEKIQLVLETFRCVVADLSEQFEGGHPGYVL